jgi:glycerate-2-kinase
MLLDVEASSAMPFLVAAVSEILGHGPFEILAGPASANRTVSYFAVHVLARIRRRVVGASSPPTFIQDWVAGIWTAQGAAMSMLLRVSRSMESLMIF